MNRKSFIRRIEVQIGIILGVVMFSILGVFLGIRRGEEKQQEATVVAKVEGSTPDVLLKALEQAQPQKGTSARVATAAQSPEEQVQQLPPKEAVVAQGTGEATLDQEAVAPTSAIATPDADVHAEVAGAQLAPTTETQVTAGPIPGRKVVAEITPPKAPAVSLPTTHTVKANDTLTSLARRYYGSDSKWPLIYEANKLSNQHTLIVGQKLTIPSPKEVKAEKATVKVSSEKTRRASPGRAYRVQQGDTLYNLARTYYGDEAQWKKIYNANQDVFSQRESLEPGDILIIP